MDEPHPISSASGVAGSYANVSDSDEVDSFSFPSQGPFFVARPSSTLGRGDRFPNSSKTIEYDDMLVDVGYPRTRVGMVQQGPDRTEQFSQSTPNIAYATDYPDTGWPPEPQHQFGNESFSPYIGLTPLEYGVSDHTDHFYRPLFYCGIPVPSRPLSGFGYYSSHFQPIESSSATIDLGWMRATPSVPPSTTYTPQLPLDDVTESQPELPAPVSQYSLSGPVYIQASCPEQPLVEYKTVCEESAAMDNEEIPAEPVESLSTESQHSSASGGRLCLRLNFDLGASALGSTTLSRSLSKPVFCPRQRKTSKLIGVTGTEDCSQGLETKNQLIFFQCKADSMCYAGPKGGREPIIWTQPIIGPVSDLLWADPGHLIVASGDTLALVDIGFDLNVYEVFYLPTFHSDYIREFALSENRLVLSAGQDGCVFLTDIVKMSQDTMVNASTTENSVYVADPQGNGIGSVRWHPHDQFVGSCTADAGRFHLFDIRSDSKDNPPLIMNTRREIFAHCYLTDTEIALGYGDGEIQLIDYRKDGIIAATSDPIGRAIGDLHSFGTSIIGFGQQRIGLWNTHDNESSETSLCGTRVEQVEARDVCLSVESKTAGTVLGALVAATTSDGVFQIYDVI